MTQASPHGRPLLGLAGAVVAAAVVGLLPTPDGLSVEGKRLAAVFAATLILWATEALPVGVTGLLAVALQPIVGAQGPRAAFDGFMSPAFLFVVAMFCIAESLLGSGVARRFALWLLSRAGTESRRVLLAFMVGTAVISTVVSDVPACAIFMVIAVGVLEKTGCAAGSSNFGKSLMMGIPIAALIGGVATPAGSSVNILGIYFIEEFGKVRVPFLGWMAIGIPMVLVLIPTAWWVLSRLLPSEISDVGDLSEVRRDRAALGGLGASEKKVLTLVLVMIVLWISSTWVEAIDVTVVALVGAIVMFVPGIRVLDWKRFEGAVGWDALFMVGGVTSLGSASVATGLAKWLVDATLPGVGAWPAVAIVAAISAFTVVAHLALPIAPVINAVLIPPIALLALESGQDPILYALPVAFTASCAFLLPLDAVPLITYSKGYYRMFDMLVPGTIISALWVVLMTVLMVFLFPFVIP